MAKLKRYNATVKYDGTAFDPHVTGVITLPDGTKQTFVRHHEGSSYQVKNGPFTMGRKWYTLDTPTGEARFETFDELMQKGLGLTQVKEN